jgi:basic membrane protein A
MQEKQKRKLELSRRKNMKKLTKYLALLLLVLLVFTSTACSSNNEQSQQEEQPSEAAEQPEEKEEAKEVPSAALALVGPISDMGWNASAYDGLMKIQEKYGAETTYTENVPPSDYEEVIRGFAVAGYKVVFAHGSQFNDAVLAVAPDFPDTMFIITNGLKVEGPNVAAVQVADEEQGFLMGAFAALMTETGKIGVIGGEAIPPITKAVEGFEVGAKYANPDVEVLSAMTGTFNDINKIKEVALVQIDEGADYIGAVANQGGLGAIEATVERGVYSIGSGVDQFDIAPEAVVVSVAKDVSVAYDFAYSNFIEGTLEPGIHKIGAKEGLIYYTPYHDFEDFVPDSVKERVAEILKDLEEGKVTILQQ